MLVGISRDAIELIRAETAKSPDAEVCGLLLGSGEVVEAQPCRNVADDPARRFEIDPAALIAAHKAARAGGPAIVGHYHSHPGGDARPSFRDAANAPGDGAIWLIAGRDGLRAWRNTAPGEFDEAGRW